MSIGSSSLGRTVLEITTDAAPLRRGFAEARATTTREAAELKRRARVELSADLLRLRRDFNQAEREARTAARLMEQRSRFDLSVNLARFRSDLRMAEREHQASLRRMQAQGGGGEGLPIGGAGGVLGVAAGLAGAAVLPGIAAVGAGAKVALDYNAAVESAEQSILALSRSQATLAETQRIANEAVAKGVGGYEETLTALAGLIPLSRRYNANLEQLLTTAQLLAALDPAQGFEGAQTALREALSGDFTSLIRRFEIPRAEIERLKAEGVPNLQIVQRVLQDLGVTTDLLAARSQTFTQRLAIAGDTVRRFLAGAGAPAFRGASDALAAFVRALNSPEAQRVAREYSTNLANALNDVRRFASDPQVREGFARVAGLAGELFLAVSRLSADTWAPTLEAVKNLVVFAGNVAVGLQTVYDWLIRIRDSGVLEALARVALPLPAAVAGLAGRALTEPAQAGPSRGVVERPVTPYNPYDDGYTQGAAPLPPESIARAPARIGGGPDTLPDTRFGEQLAAQLAQARAALRGFAQDWDTTLFDLFDDLAPRVRSAFEQAFGHLSLREQAARGLGDLDALTGRIVEDIQTTGRVSEETAARVVATLGDQGQAVLALANEYAALVAAQRRAADAAAALESAQDALADAQQLAQDHAEASREAIDALQRSMSALSREAADVARGYQDRLDALRDERQAAEEAAEAHRRSFQEQIDGLASVRRARERDEAVKNLEAGQRATLLDFEERIRAARRGGDVRGARALEQERDRFLARSNYQLDLERQRAAVAKDRADRESAAIEAQAQAQADKDKAALDAIDERIDALEDEARQVARDYEDRQRALQALIDREEERARVVAAADKQAVRDAQDRVDRAREAKAAADGEAAAQQTKVTALERQDTLLGQQLGKWKDFIDYLRGLGIDVARFFNGGPSAPVPGDPPRQAPPNPVVGPNAGDFLVAAPSYTPPSPPAPSGSWVAAGAGGGGGGPSYALRSGGVTVNGPVVSLPNMTVRETADVDLVIERAAEKAQTELLAALVDDERSGGGVTSRA